MKVICSGQYGVVEVDTYTEHIERVLPGDYESMPYGITWDEDYMYVSQRKLCCGRQRIVVLDKNYDYVDSIHLGYPEFKTGELHQIIYRYGRLWVTVSGYNAIMIVDMNHHGQVEYWYPESEYRGSDIHHWNSIWFEGDYLYLVAHKRGVSDVYQFDCPSMDISNIWRNVAFGAHNIFRFNGALCTLDTSQGALRSGIAFVEEQTVNRMFPQGHFPRGVAVTPNDDLIIGRSVHIKNPAKRKQERRSWVELYDWSAMRHGNYMPRKSIQLKIGQLNEIRGLDFHDTAHHEMLWD